MSFTASVKKWQQQDPVDFAKALPGLVKVVNVTYQSVTQTFLTIPAFSIVKDVTVIRTTKWNAAPTTFEIGKQGDTDWLVNTTQANVDGNIPAGEDAGTEVISINKTVTSDTPIVLTLNHGAATAGSGYVMVRYEELAR
jgi:hypothetical protein